MIDFNRHLACQKERVEQYLQTALARAGEVPAALLEAMAYALLSPGKRLRPLLVVLSAEACGGDAASALPAASAVEMTHTYSLVHDDLPAMDDDDLRRGRPTCHKRFGEAVAILAGDALLTLAFQVLTEAYPATTAAGCCRELARGAGAAGMVGGQADDLAWEQRMGLPQPQGDGSAGRPPTADDLEAIHAKKTGALFRSCLRMGAWVVQGERAGGPDVELLTRLDAYGRCFGQAFQITDDLLDVEGTAAQTGKRVQKDAARGKLTYPGFLGKQQSRQAAQELCRLAAEHLSPLGPAAGHLTALAERILDRDR